MVVAVLADDPNYDYYLLKLTTGPETIEQRFSDSILIFRSFEFCQYSNRHSCNKISLEPKDRLNLRKLFGEFFYIVEKGMVVAVLADDPNYDYYLLKLTTGPETIEQRFSDSWGGTFDKKLNFVFKSILKRK
jgi:hypothetical protein